MIRLSVGVHGFRMHIKMDPIYVYEHRPGLMLYYYFNLFIFIFRLLIGDRTEEWGGMFTDLQLV